MTRTAPIHSAPPLLAALLDRLELEGCREWLRLASGLASWLLIVLALVHLPHSLWALADLAIGIGFLCFHRCVARMICGVCGIAVGSVVFWQAHSLPECHLSPDCADLQLLTLLISFLQTISADCRGDRAVMNEVVNRPDSHL